VVFGRRGFAGLCVYLALLYGVAYVAVRPAGRPSIGVQLFTFVFYGLAIGGLWFHRRREPQPEARTHVEKRELHLITVLFAVLLVLALVLSALRRSPVLYAPIAVNFIIWTALGFVLTALSLAKGIRESFGNGETPRQTAIDERTVQ
jgi:amino acid transporter